MATSTISIQVDEAAAQAFTALPLPQRKTIELVLGLQFKDLALRPRRSLSEIMDDIGREAEANGMTPEILDSILNER